MTENGIAWPDGSIRLERLVTFEFGSVWEAFPPDARIVGYEDSETRKPCAVYVRHESVGIFKKKTVTERIPIDRFRSSRVHHLPDGIGDSELIDVIGINAGGVD